MIRIKVNNQDWKNRAEHPHQEFSGVPPSPHRTVVKTFHELEWCSLIYPRFGKYGEEEYWIFNTQNLADRKTNRQSFSLDRQLCFLLSCFYKQTSAFMSIPLPYVQETFHVPCPVWSSLYQYYSIATCKKPLVSKVHPQAFVTTGSSIFSLTTSSGIFRGRGYAFAG